MGRQKEAGASVESSCDASAAPPRRKHPNCAWGGEELVDPHVEGHFLDPEIMLGSDKDLGDGEAGLIAADALLVGFVIDSRRVVVKANIRDICTSICN